MSSSKNKEVIALPVALAAFTGGVLAFVSASRYLSSKREKEVKKLEDTKLEAFYRLENARSISLGSVPGKPVLGTRLTDVTIDEVYLWAVEHLSKKFKSEAPESLINHMHGTSYNSAPLPENAPTFLRAFSSLSEADSKSGNVSKKTHYNKLIGVNECILGDIVRKPGSNSVSKAFIRAGPRRKLHFNPETVNAAIVTCGGLCPGLNNV